MKKSVTQMSLCHTFLFWAKKSEIKYTFKEFKSMKGEQDKIMITGELKNKID